MRNILTVGSGNDLEAVVEVAAKLLARIEGDA